MKLDAECFKLQDPRIQAVEKGRLSVQALIKSIQFGDWLIQYKNTVYALTQDEYYAAQQLKPQFILTKELFQTFLESFEQYSLSQQDIITLRKIKQQKKGCSTCKYNSFKTRVRNILRKYPDIQKNLFKGTFLQPQIKLRQYPNTKAVLQSKISKIIPSFFSVQQYKMEPCLDCVEKHLCMAYRKGCQAEKGYPEHLVFAVADLQNAYQECPSDMAFLKEHLMFCIGKTIKDGKAFIPIQNLLYLINLARRTTASIEANVKNQQNSQYALDFDQNTIKILQELDILSKMTLIKEVKILIDIIYKDNKLLEQEFQGQMGILEDAILQYSIAAGNVLRNRRLLFKYAPQMIRNTQYDCKDLLKFLQYNDNQEKV